MGEVVKGTTEQDWWIPTDLRGEERELNHRVVVAGPKDRPHLIADCRSTTLPASEVEANTRLICRAPALALSLIRIEREVGDLKACAVTDQIYSIIADAMRGLQLRPRHDPDEDHA